MKPSWDAIMNTFWDFYQKFRDVIKNSSKGSQRNSSRDYSGFHQATTDRSRNLLRDFTRIFFSGVSLENYPRDSSWNPLREPSGISQAISQFPIKISPVIPSQLWREQFFEEFPQKFYQSLHWEYHQSFASIFTRKIYQSFVSSSTRKYYKCFTRNSLFIVQKFLQGINRRKSTRFFFFETSTIFPRENLP